jgi:FkbM family methyltransferase
VDVGANRGYYSYVMSGIFAHVLAFEPNSTLTHDLAHSDANNITIHHCALSDTDGTLRLHVPYRDGRPYDGWATVERPQLSAWDTFDVTDVPGRRLDGFGLQDVSLVKIDVEGHEVAVLDGAAHTLALHRPVVVIEVKLVNRAAVDRSLRRLDLAAHVLTGGRLRRLPGGLERYDGPKDTFVFVPAERANDGDVCGAGSTENRPCA